MNYIEKFFLECKEVLSIIIICLYSMIGDKKMKIVVIGASSYIGSEIYKAANKQSIDTIGTQYSSNLNNLLRFNILEDDIEVFDSRIKNEKEKYAVLCSADTNINSCYINYEKAYKVNVVATKRLIDRLYSANYKIIYFSTDNVFDGKKGDYTETDFPNPINRYGEMKREMEEYFLDNIPNGCIMRIGKIIGNYNSERDLLMEWYKKALNKELIYCIKNNIFTLTHVNDIVNSLFLIMKYNLNGLYNVVGNDSFSRKKYCQKFLEHVELKTDILEKDVMYFNFKDKRPLNISMKNTKFIKETDYHFMTIDEINQEFFRKVIHNEK